MSQYMLKHTYDPRVSYVRTTYDEDSIIDFCVSIMFTAEGMIKPEIHISPGAMMFLLPLVDWYEEFECSLEPFASPPVSVEIDLYIERERHVHCSHGHHIEEGHLPKLKKAFAKYRASPTHIMHPLDF